MVQSKVNNTIHYSETKSLEPDDAHMEVDMFEMEIYGVDVIIALGNMKNTYESQHVLFFPIYLVKKTNNVIRIGIFEIVAEDLLTYLDADGNIDVDKLNTPLLFHFVNKAMLTELRLKPEGEVSTQMVDGDEQQKEDVVERKEDVKNKDNVPNTEQITDKDILEKYTKIPTEYAEVFELTKGIPVLPILPAETDEDAKYIRLKYREKPDDTWIQRFMKNPLYYIVDNEGGGDCLFATIRDAFSSIGHQTTTTKLRAFLAKEATDTIFAGYKEQYDMYLATFTEETNNVKQMKNEYELIKTKVANTLERDEKIQLMNVAKDIKAAHDKQVEEKKVTAQLLNEFKFMKGVGTLDQFKKKIQTCDFWAETWAISTLERILEIKIIILSSEAYKSGDIKNVVQCGQLNDNVLQNRGVFVPRFYIIVEHTGVHYKLIGYNHKQIFQFSELPFDLKILITDKCLERNAGPFSLIPDFMRQNNYRKQDAKNNRISDSGMGMGMGKEPAYFDVFSESKLRGLYDEDIVFMFYDKSNDKPLPGKGTGEKIAANKVKEFAPLAKFPHWRRELDDEYMLDPVAPLFTLDNHTWASVEHFYQASKFKKENPNFYLSFTLESGTDISKSAEMAQGAGGKSGKYKKDLIRPKEVKVDADFFSERKAATIYEGQYAKFTQNPALGAMLKATLNAKLTHYQRGAPAETVDSLIQVREKLKSEPV